MACGLVVESSTSTVTGNNYLNSRDRLASYNEYCVRPRPKVQGSGVEKLRYKYDQQVWLRLTNVKEKPPEESIFCSDLI
jgi:hypothetical protein